MLILNLNWINLKSSKNQDLSNEIDLHLRYFYTRFKFLSPCSLFLSQPTNPDLHKLLKLFLIFAGICFMQNASAQKYFVTFSDKNNNTYSISNPEEFLSDKAIERRTKQNIAISEEDLPVTQDYLDRMKNLDLQIIWTSKWLNGAIVSSSNNAFMDTIDKIDFIDSCTLIYPYPTNVNSLVYKKQELINQTKINSSGFVTTTQNELVNGQYLHNKGFKGEGKIIAVIDNGFNHVNTFPLFEQLWENNQIFATKDFVNPGSSVYNTESTHGTYVLSIMGGYEEDSYCGSSPDASYLLLRTEDEDSEYPIEEYNWVIAAEYADSIGADIIQSSLGYFQFEDSSMNYSYKDMDGSSTICVKGANAAFSKGILVICAAGNEGNDDWHYIISPADGENILAVGAVNSDSTVCSFSSYGPSYDQRVKPDVMAMGQNVAIQNSSGEISYGVGTSFAAPVISGFAACLWEEYPDLTNTEILQSIRESANLYNSPNSQMGYGIADFKEAQELLNSYSSKKEGNSIYPNPFQDYLHIKLSNATNSPTTITLWNINGNLVSSNTFSNSRTYTMTGLTYLPQGIYIVQVVNTNGSSAYKMVKK